MAAFSGILGTPIIILGFLCIEENDYGYVIRSKIISSMFFAAGLSTLLQTLLGARLPILQGIFIRGIIVIFMFTSSQALS